MRTSDSRQFDISKVRPLLERALDEDIGRGDVTTEIFIPPDLGGQGDFVARQSGVLAGGILLEPLFCLLDPGVDVELKIEDGSPLNVGDVIASIEGTAAAILRGERPALNFLTHLSGIASLTRLYVEAVKGTTARILDTRKTTPGWRVLEKYAVRMGGGHNHRMGLYDQILIKDNHLQLIARSELGDAIARARKEHLGMLVELEVESLEELKDVLNLGLDIVMLDNMAPEQLRQAVRMVGKLPAVRRPVLEASGGITLASVGEVALTGIDHISVGVLTHSAPALDVSLELRPRCQHVEVLDEE